MTWTRLESAARVHPKLVRAKKMANKTRAGRGDAVVAMWANAMMFANDVGSDGFIPADMLEDLTEDRAPDEVAGFLVACSVRPGGAGLFDVAEGGYQIHDFLEYNDPAEAVRSRKKANAERMKAARAPHVHAHKSRTQGARAPSVPPDNPSTTDAQDAHVPGTADARSDVVPRVHAPASAGGARPHSGPVRSGPEIPPSPPKGGQPSDDDLPAHGCADLAWLRALRLASAKGVAQRERDRHEVQVFWQAEEAAGASWQAFCNGLATDAAAWVRELLASPKGEWRFSKGWPFGHFEQWLAARDALAGAPVAPGSRWDDPDDAEVSAGGASA